MFTLPCASRCDESIGFPSALRACARAAVAVVAHGETAPPSRAFSVNAAGETLWIPYRLYYDPARLRDALTNAQGIDKIMVACLGTRHCDGYVRQECLAQILGGGEPWLMPYIVQLAGEYVIEIVHDVLREMHMRDTSALAAFARDNPTYLATLSRRATSYWNCYHRRDYPDRADYPGTRVLARILAAVVVTSGSFAQR
jgi:hypothetical protein